MNRMLSRLARLLAILRLAGWKCRFGAALKAHPFRVWLEPGVVISIERGGSISIGDGVYIRRNAVLHANGGRISLGKTAFINRNSSLNSRKSIEVAEGVLIGEHVMIYDHDHDMCAEDPHSSFLCEPVRIEPEAWIGSGAILLRGTVIGKRSVVGAGALIKKVIGPNMKVIQHRNTTLTPL